MDYGAVMIMKILGTSSSSTAATICFIINSPRALCLVLQIKHYSAQIQHYSAQ